MNKLQEIVKIKIQTEDLLKKEMQKLKIIEDIPESMFARCSSLFESWTTENQKEYKQYHHDLKCSIKECKAIIAECDSDLYKFLTTREIK